MALLSVRSPAVSGRRSPSMKRIGWVAAAGVGVIVGCGGSSGGFDSVGELGQEAIFTPRPNLGVNFVGGGPSGNPQPMDSTEVAGVVPYNFWNNATAATGSQLVPTSDGGASEIQVQW